MPLQTQKPILMTIQTQLRPDSQQAFAKLQARFNAAIVQAPGFVSVEFLAHGMIVQRFSDEQFASAWRASTSYTELLAELKKCAIDQQVHEDFSAESSLEHGVTEVIITEVSPAQEKAYQAWSSKIHQAEAAFPGFHGVYVQAPVKGKGRHWITLLQFDTIENLDGWLDSKERQALLNESIPLISSLETHRMISPFSGWFASIAKRGEMPPVWKQTMVVLLVLFPIVMLELKYLYPWLTHLNISLKTFIGNAVSVSLISFPMMPIAIWFLNWWLSPNPQQNTSTKNFLGTGLVMLLYGLSVFFFWDFF
ncbi:MAG: hypothetical protein CK425_06650 [Parachlamydia sp.]|nr:MAG: hypothetical protein CK425_06650 [Parachlamydia sp.]